MATSMVVALKTLFFVLTCVMAAALVYLYGVDFSSCVDLNAWWTLTVETNFCLYIIFVMAWYFYKESSWIKRLLFSYLIFWCGSFITCGYILTQFSKLSPDESSTDPLYFVLVKRQKGEVIMGHTRRYSVVTAKVIVAALGCYMIGFTAHAYIVDGFPFNVEVLTRCMIVTLTDLQIYVIIFSVWIAYKESSLTSVVVWILLQECFGSLALCIYTLRQLFLLSPGQPISYILFNQHGRDLMASEPLLTEHSNV